MIEETQLDTEKEIVHIMVSNGPDRTEDGRGAKDSNGGAKEKREELKKVEATSTQRKDSGKKDSVASRLKKDGGKERNVASKNKERVSLMAADTQGGTEGEVMVTRIDERSSTRGKDCLNDSFDDIVKRRPTAIGDRVPSPAIDYDDSDFSLEDVSITYSFNSNETSGDKGKKYNSPSRKNDPGTSDIVIAGTVIYEEGTHSTDGRVNGVMRNGGRDSRTLSLKDRCREMIEEDEELMTVDDCRYKGKKISKKVPQINVEKTSIERGRAALISQSSGRNSFNGGMTVPSDKGKGEGRSVHDSAGEDMNEDPTSVEYSVSSDDVTWSPPTKMKSLATNDKAAKAVHFAPVVSSKPLANSSNDNTNTGK